MKTLTKLNLFLVAIAFALGTFTSANAQTITIVPNQATTGSTATVLTGHTTFDDQGIVWAINNWNPNTLATRGNQNPANQHLNFQFYNVTSIPGRITRVELNVPSNIGVNNETGNRLNSANIRLVVGNSAQVGTTVGTIESQAVAGDGGSVFWVLTGNETYFRIQYTQGATTGTALIANIAITYEVPEVYPPSFSVLPGELRLDPINVAITNHTENPAAEIFFSTDPDAPRGEFIPYTGPIQISETTILRSFARVGSDESVIAAATYTFLRNDIAWTFTGATTGAPSITLPNVTASAMTGTPGSGINTSFASAGYLGASGTNNLGITATAEGPNRFEFTLTPEQDYGFYLEEISFGIRRGPAGGANHTAGDVMWQLRSSRDNFTSNIATRTVALPAGTWVLDINSGLDIRSTEPETFHIIISGVTGIEGNVTHNIRIDDIRLGVTAFEIPPDYVEVPAIAPDGGTFLTAQEVSITHPLHQAGDVTIHFTTDGNDPTDASPTLAYGATIPVAETTEIRAIAISIDGESDIAYATFTILRNDIAWTFTNAFATPPPALGIGAPSITLPNITASAMTRFNPGALAGGDPVNPSNASTGAYPGASGTNNIALITRASTPDSSFFEFTLTPDAAFGFLLDEISLGIRRAAAGSSTANLTMELRSCRDGFAANIAATPIANLPVDAWTLERRADLNFRSDTAITFRIYALGGTATGTGPSLRIDDIRLGISAVEIPTITANRDLIDFDEVLEGTTATENIVVTRHHFTEAVTFAIEGPDAAAFSYDDTEWTASGGTLAIGFTPNAEAVFNASIRFSTAGDANDLIIPMTGEGLAAGTPLIHVSVAHDSVVPFGTTAFNTDVVRTIEVEGVNLTENIAFVLADDVNFSVVTGAGWDNLDGGDLIITFNTATPGLKETTLTITSEGATAHEIQLAGTGVGPTVELGFRTDMLHLVNESVSVIEIPITIENAFENITIASDNPLFITSRTTLPATTTDYVFEVEFTGTTAGERAIISISTGDTVRTQEFLSITNDVVIGWNFQNPTAEGRESNFGSTNNLGVEFLRDNNTHLTDGLGARAGLVSNNLTNPATTPRFWQTGPINTTAVGSEYQLILTHRQHGSNTGPRDWQLQYRIGTTGTWVNVGEVYSVENPTDVNRGGAPISADNPRPLFTNVLPAEVSNVTDLYLRWLVVGNVRIHATGTATTIAEAGTSHMSEVLLTFALPTPEPELTVSTNSESFGNQNIGTTSAERTMTVTGEFLTTIISGELTGHYDDFTVVTGQNWDYYAGGDVIITFTPTAVGERRAVWYVRSGDLVEQVVLTGTGVEDPTSICPRDIEENTVVLFPNPVVDVLNIISEQAIATVRIYNLAGQLVVRGNRNYVDMSTLPRGTYVVRIVFENGAVVTRTVVK